MAVTGTGSVPAIVKPSYPRRPKPVKQPTRKGPRKE